MSTIYKVNLSPFQGIYEVEVPVNGGIVCLVVEGGMPRIVMLDNDDMDHVTEAASVYLLDLVPDDQYIDGTVLNADGIIWTHQSSAQEDDSRWALLT